MVEELSNNGATTYPSHIPTKEDIRKHGFYYYALSEQERVFYEFALESKGLTHEIALLQAKIEYFALIYPLNITQLVAAMNALKGLMKVQYSIFQKDEGMDVNQRMGDFINSLGLRPEEHKALWDRTHSTS